VSRPVFSLTVDLGLNRSCPVPIPLAPPRQADPPRRISCRVPASSRENHRGFLDETTCPVPASHAGRAGDGSTTLPERRTPARRERGSGVRGPLRGRKNWCACGRDAALSTPYEFESRLPGRIAAHRIDTDRWDSRRWVHPLISIVRDPSRRDHFRRTRRDNLSRRAGDLFLPRSSL